MFHRIKTAADEGRRLVMITPNPWPSYAKVAYMINKYRVDCRNLWTFNMDEYANEHGQTPPESWEFGFMHVRQQTWLPFNQFVMINGREWLGRQMDRAGIKYLRRENCFAWVSDVARAQELLQQQVSFNWTAAVDELSAQVNPAWPSLRVSASALRSPRSQAW